MTLMPPGLGLLFALLLLGALAAWVLHRGLKKQASTSADAEASMGSDVQAAAHRRIQQQHHHVGVSAHLVLQGQHGGFCISHHSH